MRKTSITLFGFIFVTIIMFVSFLPSIIHNAIDFQTDEMYWMQTARILPYIQENKLQDPYWKENMGFVNFNGAKWVYAIGLRMFNHTDFTDIGIPPSTYYKWKEYSGAFPTTHALYPMLFHARLISAFTASIAIGGMFVFGYLLFPNSILVALASAILLRIHPITINIATHAFADSMLLLAEIAWASILSYIIKYSQNTRHWLITLGVVLGYAVSVKINAGMFYIITIFLIAAGAKTTTAQYIHKILLITISAGLTFVLLHPNFFFFPSYTLYQMIADRFLITQYHMTYFSRIDASHVLYSIPQRLHSLFSHIFTPVLKVFFTFGTIYSISLILKRRGMQKNIFLLLWISTGIILEFLLAYVVFDEQRYFMPLLPFVCLVSSSWLLVITP